MRGGRRGEAAEVAAAAAGQSCSNTNTAAAPPERARLGDDLRGAPLSLHRLSIARLTYLALLAALLRHTALSHSLLRRADAVVASAAGDLAQSTVLAALRTRQRRYDLSLPKHTRALTKAAMRQLLRLHAHLLVHLSSLQSRVHSGRVGLHIPRTAAPGGCLVCSLTATRRQPPLATAGQPLSLCATR